MKWRIRQEGEEDKSKDKGKVTKRSDFLLPELRLDTFQPAEQVNAPCSHSRAMKLFRLFFPSQKPVIIFLHPSPLIFFCCFLLTLVLISNLPSIPQCSGASQIAFVHFYMTGDGVWVACLCVYVKKESLTAGWWVEIEVIMECYLFIKNTVGNLLTAFRSQLKQHKLLALADLAGGVREVVLVRRKMVKVQQN